MTPFRLATAYRGCAMTAYMEILHQYILISIEVFFGFYFYVKFLHKKIKLCYFLLFGGCTVCVIYFVPGGTIVELGVFVLFLAAAGIRICQADLRPAVLYAVLTVEIMQLGYGIMKSLLSILYPYLSEFDQNRVVFVVSSNKFIIEAAKK